MKIKRKHKNIFTGKIEERNFYIRKPKDKSLKKWKQ